MWFGACNLTRVGYWVAAGPAACNDTARLLSVPAGRYPTLLTFAG